MSPQFLQSGKMEGLTHGCQNSVIVQHNSVVTSKPGNSCEYPQTSLVALGPGDLGHPLVTLSRKVFIGRLLGILTGFKFVLDNIDVKQGSASLRS